MQPEQLQHIRVADCMHHGILSCDGATALEDVARMMVQRRVHAIAVTAEDSTRPDAVVTSLDVTAAVASGEATTARAAAATEPLTVSSAEPLKRAAQLMSEHGVSHLVVIDAAGGYPIGVLSTLDIAAVYAGSSQE